MYVIFGVICIKRKGYFLCCYLIFWLFVNIFVFVYSIGLLKKKVVYYVSYIKFVILNRNIIFICICIMSIKLFFDIFSLILLMISLFKMYIYNVKFL